MRILAIFLGLALSPVPIFAACGSSDLTLKDSALGRQWLMQRDCRHPERPARLIEIPWSDRTATSANEPVPATDRTILLIRPGMRVTVHRESDGAQIHLTGVALEPGYAGQKILVKAGLGAAPLHGIVRSGDLVVLEPEKGGH